MLDSRSLPWVILGVGGILVAIWAGGTRETPPTPLASEARQDHLRETHYVTPRQVAASNAMVDRVVDLEEFAAEGRPVVLVFIKAGCPCSVEFEPFFHRVEKLYRDEVRFAGVIDASAEEANAYRAAQHVPYPVLADPRRRLIRRFRVENGGYVALLTPDGVIAGFWPGCTAVTLEQLGGRIARLVGVPQRPLDMSGMPASLITGCPFES
jgi:peroxiredoxin